MSPDQVRDELSRVLASSAFQDADRAKSFLSFIVTTTLDGRGSEIKESVIAVEALGRSTSFDPKADPIVRVEAGRLRQRLKTYYHLEGATDPVLITLPKGTYVPEFYEQEVPNLPPAASRRPAWVWTLLAGLVAGLSISGMVFLAFRGVPPEMPTLRLSLIPPPGSTIETSRVSPNGRMIAFTAFQQNRTMLWIRSLDSPEARLIPGTETATQVFWSPDSRSVGFFSTDRLLRVEVAGGPPQEICPVTIPMGGGSWGRNGTIVFSARPVGVLYQVPATGGAPKPATLLDNKRAEFTHRFPEFLPDGRHFLYVANSGNGQPTAVRIASIDSTDSKVLLEGAANAAYVPASLGKPASLLFYFQGALMSQPFDPSRRELSGGRTVVAPQVFYRYGRADFSVSENRTLIYRASSRKDRQLAWYDRTGRLVEKVGDQNDYYSLRLSQDDQRLAFIEEEPDWSSAVWLMELATRRLSRVANPGRDCFHPVWSPDSKEVLYTSGSEQGMKLQRQPMTSTTPSTVLDTPGPKFASDWSADGQYIMYFTPWPDFIRLRTALVELKTGSQRTLLESTYNETEAVFSPDKKGPRWIAYTSTETGRSEICIRSFPDLRVKLQISNSGGWQPQWRKDGGELFYLSPDGTINAVHVTAGKELRADAPRPLFRTNIPPYPGRPELPARSYAVSQNGQRFLVNQVMDGDARNSISVIIRW